MTTTHPQKMGRRWKQYWPAKWSLFVRQLFEINNPNSWSTGSTKGILADDTDLFITWYIYRKSNIYRQKTILISHYIFQSPCVCHFCIFFPWKAVFYQRVFVFVFFSTILSATKRMQCESAWSHSILRFAVLWRRVIYIYNTTYQSNSLSESSSGPLKVQVQG